MDAKLKSKLDKVNMTIEENRKRIEMLKKKLEDDIQNIHSENIQLFKDAKQQTRGCKYYDCPTIDGVYEYEWGEWNSTKTSPDSRCLKKSKIHDCPNCHRPMCSLHGSKCEKVCMLCNPNHWTFE